MSMILTLSGMSTSGKTTLAKALTRVAPDEFEETISVTTRPRRSGEMIGVDYHFFNENQFEECIENDLLIEHVKTHGAYYGTLKSELDRIIDQGKSVVLVLDPQGAHSIKGLAMDKGINVKCCFLSVDMDVLLLRFFNRINEQILSGKPLDIESEAQRLETMLVTEQSWKDMLSWDKVFSNIHRDGLFDKAIDQLRQMHHLDEEPIYSDKRLIKADTPYSGVNRNMLIDIITNQLVSPKPYHWLAKDIDKMFLDDTRLIKSKHGKHQAGLNL